MLSLIIPTYNERENIISLIQELLAIFQQNSIPAEIIIVDDNSPDGTATEVQTILGKHPNIRLVVRNGKEGLSSAVLAGFALSQETIVGVMDADGSHSSQDVVHLYQAITSPSTGSSPDFVIGSRYITSGNIEGWPWVRKLISKGATLLARPFTSVKDPLSGFFMIKKQCIEKIDFDSKGFKICLEFIVKAHWKQIIEVPITFTNRKRGKSKANFWEGVYYLRNLCKYVFYKWPACLEYFRFITVGAMGIVINILILYALTEYVGMYYLYSSILAFLGAVTHNFFLNRSWTFFKSKKQEKGVLILYFKFLVLAVTVLGINLFLLSHFVEHYGWWYIAGQFISISIASGVNFIGSKYWVFKS